MPTIGAATPITRMNYGTQYNDKKINYAQPRREWANVNITDDSWRSTSTYTTGDYNDTLNLNGSQQKVTANLGAGYNRVSTGWPSANSNINVQMYGGYTTLIGTGHTLNLNSGKGNDDVRIGFFDDGAVTTNYKGTLNLANGNNNVQINGYARGNNLTFNAGTAGNNSFSITDYSMDDIKEVKKIASNMYQLTDFKGNTYNINSAFKSITLHTRIVNAQNPYGYFQSTTKTLEQLDQLK
ncbi:MAG: hypothetical protein QE263_04325 [Vampirovibrionales bacterium]|nr:hypothetical protein [Vampirovibrionales bacterium]